jgi:hypothetical protein
MKPWIMMLWVSVSLWAANPLAFSGLGNVIYDGMEKVAQLGDAQAVSSHHENIGKYLEKCERAKDEGYALDRRAPGAMDKKAYLELLRSLNNEYEFYVRTANVALNRTIEENNFAAFSELIKTDLIDIDKNSEQIISFYEMHRNGGVLQEIDDYIDFQKQLKELEQKEKAKRQQLYDDYRQRRIDQVHARQKAKKEAHRKAVEEETRRKKEELHRRQEEELKFSN